MRPVKKLRLQGETTGIRTRLRFNINRTHLLSKHGVPLPSTGAACTGRPRGKTADAACSSNETERPARAPSQTMVNGNSTLFEMPRGYFFFWAFSAAFVTLPVVTSLKFTLCNNIFFVRNLHIFHSHSPNSNYYGHQIWTSEEHSAISISGQCRVASVASRRNFTFWNV